MPRRHAYLDGLLGGQICRRASLRNRPTVDVSDGDLQAMVERGYEGAANTDHDQQAQASRLAAAAQGWVPPAAVRGGRLVSPAADRLGWSRPTRSFR